MKYVGADIQILPDLSKATLQRPALLRPFLQVLREKGYVYRWGYPFHLVVRNGNSSFSHYSLKDLPRLFKFLNMEQMEVPNWMNCLPPPQTPAEAPGVRDTEIARLTLGMGNMERGLLRWSTGPTELRLCDPITPTFLTRCCSGGLSTATPGTSDCK